MHESSNVHFIICYIIVRRQVEPEMPVQEATPVRQFDQPASLGEEWSNDHAKDHGP